MFFILCSCFVGLFVYLLIPLFISFVYLLAQVSGNWGKAEKCTVVVAAAFSTDMQAKLESGMPPPAILVTSLSVYLTMPCFYFTTAVNIGVLQKACN